MSVTFYPAIIDADIVAWGGKCYAGGNGPVPVGVAATREEAVERVAMHTLECEDCRVYNCYVTTMMEVPEVNMSNANARYIMELLGIEFDGADSMPAAKFVERLDFAMIVGGGDTGTVPVTYVDESVWGGATVVDCGRPAGYADERLEQLREVADWALAHGREVLWS